MARIRTIKPDFFKNEQLSELPAMNRLLFIGLWTQADREGKLKDSPKRLKIEIFPYDNFDMDKGLDKLKDAGLILRYKVNANITDRILTPEQPNEEAYIKIPTFGVHQQPNIKEAASIIPEPCFYQAPYNHHADTVLASQERKGKEGKGTGMEGNIPHKIDFEKICLEESTQWQESMMKNFKISSTEEIKEWIRKFFLMLSAADEEKTDLRDARSHCSKWINIQLERIKEKSSGQKEKGQTKFEKLEETFNQVKNPYA